MCNGRKPVVHRNTQNLHTMRGKTFCFLNLCIKLIICLWFFAGRLYKNKRMKCRRGAETKTSRLRTSASGLQARKDWDERTRDLRVCVLMWRGISQHRQHASKDSKLQLQGGEQSRSSSHYSWRCEEASACLNHAILPARLQNPPTPVQTWLFPYRPVGALSAPSAPWSSAATGLLCFFQKCFFSFKVHQ